MRLGHGAPSLSQQLRMGYAPPPAQNVRFKWLAFPSVVFELKVISLLIHYCLLASSELAESCCQILAACKRESNLHMARQPALQYETFNEKLTFPIHYISLKLADASAIKLLVR